MSAIEPPEKKKHGCLFYGCITLLVGGLVAAIAILFAIHYAAGMLNAKIAEYTDTQPMVFPKTEMSADELQKLQHRLDAFNAALDAHSNAVPLVLTSRDINALMGANTNFVGLKDMCYVDITNDTVKGELSLPLEKYFKVPLLHFKGRYLNGVGTFKVGVTNQMLSVQVESLEVKGKPLPEEFMRELRAKNMAEDYDRNPTNAVVLDRFESIEVHDGKVTVKAKSQ